MASRRVSIRRAEMKKARIEIIPMIDTIFFLLVFFLMVSLSQTKMNGMGTSLPKDSPPSTAKPPPKAVVTDTAAGDLFINTTKVDLAQLNTQLQSMINADPTTIIIVNLDKTRKVQEAITVMDAVNSVQLPPQAVTPDNNVPTIMIATTPVDASGNAAPAPTGTASTTATGSGGTP